MHTQHTQGFYDKKINLLELEHKEELAKKEKRIKLLEQQLDDEDKLADSYSKGVRFQQVLPTL
jgi:hypothetical protein